MGGFESGVGVIIYCGRWFSINRKMLRLQAE